MTHAAIQFAVLTLAAMLAYPGGAKFALHSTSHRFFENFFSDLGATRTYSGLANTPSHVMLIFALASVGVALIPFGGAWRSLAPARLRLRRLSQVLAALSGVGFIDIAATPWDRVLDAHNLSSSSPSPCCCSMC